MIEVGVGHEHIAEVADRVVLHVVHVAQASQHGLAQGLGAEGVEVDVVDLDLGRPLLQGLDVEPHRPIFATKPGDG